ncbi:MAG: hypothetical protein EAZ15_02250 [Sphingobacteriales bacterium]|nr:MAG: hypothetical protein EAZ15_02250 [Sphingobacteriales bacterium]
MKKILLWVIGIISVLIITFFVATFYVKNNWKPLLEQQLKSAILNSTDSLYSISYKSIDVNPLSGNLKLVEFKLTPNLKVYNKLVALQKAPNNLFQLNVDKLVITKANAKKAVAEKKLNIETIEINHPQLTITNKRQSYNDTLSKVKSNKTLFQLIKNIFEEVQVGKIMLNDIDFTHINSNKNKTKKTAIKNLNISITDILVDSISQNDSSRLYYTKSIDIKLEGYKIATPDSLYFVNVDSLNFSSSKNILTVSKFKLEPRMGANAFYRKVNYAKDYFNLTFNKLVFRNIDFDLFLKQQKFKAETFNITKANISVYNNNAYPKKLNDKTGRFPHQQLLKVPLEMNISKINLANVNISYTEYDAASKETGKITFNNTRGTIYNVTNNENDLAKNSVMVAKLQSNILNKAPLDLTFKFFMKSKIGAFSYVGAVGAFDGRIANQIVRPLGMAEIKSLTVKKLAFNVNANQYKAKGKMRFTYANLKVNVLKLDTNGKIKKMGFISKLANIFIIRTDNPNNTGEFIAGNIAYLRPKTTSFFSFLWKSLFMGIKESVGVNKEKEKSINKSSAAIQNLLSNIKNTMDTIKKRRAERKENREIRKLEKQQLKIDTTKIITK